MRNKGPGTDGGQRNGPGVSSGAVGFALDALSPSVSGAVLQSAHRTGSPASPRARGSGRVLGPDPPAPWSPCPAPRPQALASGCRPVRSREASPTASVSRRARSREGRCRRRRRRRRGLGCRHEAEVDVTDALRCRRDQAVIVRNAATRHSRVVVDVLAVGSALDEDDSRQAVLDFKRQRLVGDGDDVERGRCLVGQLDRCLVPCGWVVDPVTDRACWADWLSAREVLLGRSHLRPIRRVMVRQSWQCQRQ